MTALVAASKGSGIGSELEGCFRVRLAFDALSALRGANSDVDLLVVDSSLPSGIDLLRALKHRLGGIPAILVCPSWEDVDVDGIMAAGATDLAVGPAPGEVVARAKMALYVRQGERNDLLALAYTDELTGLPNRRYLLARLKGAIHTARSRQEALSVLLLDIDHFKTINDRYGHRTGDRALVEFSKVLRASSRGSDIIGRWGGEEFLYVLPGQLPAAEAQAERVRTAVSSFPFGAPEQGLQLTCSIGATQLMATDRALDVVDRADRLMYQAKSNGRDCIVASCETQLVTQERVS